VPAARDECADVGEQLEPDDEPGELASPVPRQTEMETVHSSPEAEELAVVGRPVKDACVLVREIAKVLFFPGILTCCLVCGHVGMLPVRTSGARCLDAAQSE
jgi:hypothetical protein